MTRGATRSPCIESEEVGREAGSEEDREIGLLIGGARGAEETEIQASSSLKSDDGEGSGVTRREGGEIGDGTEYSNNGRLGRPEADTCSDGDGNRPGGAGGND